MKKGKRIFSKKVFDVLGENHDRSLIINENTPFSVKEEYKTLRTNILFSFPSSGCKIIGISSAEPLEGKSTNCLNLAITFAQINARVLLMDCDFRRPNQARLVDLDAIPGISNILVGMNNAEQAVRKTGLSNLNVLLSGNIPPNPSELISSEAMGRLIEELSEDYDYIFVDLPPINIVADTAAMSKYLSGLILVIRAGESKRESVKKALSKLELAKTNIIGIILNGVKSNFHYGFKQRHYEKASKYNRN